MTELQQWQKDYIEKITAMSNSELLDEALRQYGANGEVYECNWCLACAETHLRMRLVNWLNEGENK